MGKINIKDKKYRYIVELIIYTLISLLASGMISGIVHANGKGLSPIYHVIYYFAVAMLIFLVVNPWSMLYELKLLDCDRRFIFVVTALAVLAVSGLCTIPMGMNPVWNGENPEHRNQYEELADAMLEGHLDVHREDDVSALLAMENPYDLGARYEQGIEYRWDHSFYKGHYYVYFGVVPVILLFLPYKLIFGKTLLTWQATAFFQFLLLLPFSYWVIN